MILNKDTKILNNFYILLLDLKNINSKIDSSLYSRVIIDFIIYKQLSILII